jgi:serine/threonine protein kinase
MDPAKDPFDWVGKTIDEQFTVEELVGEGGFAVVYRGHHKGFDEKIAIKALKFPAKLGEDERAKFLESFKSEGKLLHKLSKADAAIVQALDVGAATSPNGTWTPYLVLEWLEGETLEADLKKRAKDKVGGRSLGDALTLLDPVARGLATAHGMGIAHRDIKPANLFLQKQTGTSGDQKTERRSLKLVDFGIAKVMSDSEDVMKAYEATGESIHAFSPRYGAPEQFARKYGATGPWTDVFALALVLIEVVAGKSAMKGDTSQLMARATDGVTRPTLRSLGVQESDAVESVLTRALAVETVERYADAGKFWEALRDAAAKGDTVLSERTDAAPTLPEGGKKPSDSPLTPAARAQQLAVAGLLFVIGGAAAWTVIPHHGFSAPPPPAVEERPLHQADLALVPSAASPVISPTSATAAATPGYARYVNDKFHFVIDVPNDFTKMEEMPGGVGRTYTNATGDAQLQVYGGQLIGTLHDLYLDAYESREHDLDRWVFPVHTVSDDMFTITGFEKDIPFMEKVMVTGGIFGRLYAHYPPDAANKRHFEEVLPHTRDSFEFTAVSDTLPIPRPDAGTGSLSDVISEALEGGATKSADAGRPKK